MKPVLVSLFFLLGCSRPGSEPIQVQPVNGANIVGNWVLSTPKTAYKITLSVALKSTEGTATLYQLTGLAPVNSYGAVATVQADGGATLDGVMTTKKGGPPEAMDAEATYYSSLGRVNRIDLVDGKLRLRTTDPKWGVLLYVKAL